MAGFEICKSLHYVFIYILHSSLTVFEIGGCICFHAFTLFLRDTQDSMVYTTVAMEFQLET